MGMRNTGISKAVSFPSFVQVVKGYLRLVRDNYYNKSLGRVDRFADGSSTLQRSSTENESYRTAD